ncbi:MAG: MaoC family dehydratase N-terminal domain-containing protein [Gemmatimonadaceae bacterium]|nr:MaoC family dehydratase N-terminal domain-containing protein [Gemmatimonadaceae bacterium]
MTDAVPDFREWIGRTETVLDGLSPEHARRAAATFDDEVTGVGADDPLPPLWQWFYFLPFAAQSALDVDGHPQRGGFLPPIPYPRRMFAGSRMVFHRPLRLGQPAAREGEIRNVVMKSGRSGSLAFVTVQYRFTQGGVLCVEEEQDIVYREPGAAVSAPVAAPLAPATAGEWRRTITPDARLLFRFSALTFNAHRIHYDRPYAEREEGYPGLIVHGPLTAMLLADLVRRNTGRPIASFSFRGLAPLFDLAPFHLSGTPSGDSVDLVALAPDLTPALSAQVNLRD